MQRARILLNIAEKRPLSPVEHKRLMAALLRARMARNAAGLVDHETRGSPKLDEFSRVLAELCADPRRKVVVFSEWERMIRRAADRAKRLGIGHLILSGSVPTAKRGALLDRFREDPDARVFFSTDAGGVGLNLRVAQTVVNLDLPWNPALLPRDRDTDDPTALQAAVYEVLLAGEMITFDQAGALSRSGDLCRIFADREAPVPEALVIRTLEEAAAFIDPERPRVP